jgi:hypothetical protein
VIDVIRVLIDVRNGATRSGVVAQARSLPEEASVAAAAYPNADIRVTFPIDPEAFFVGDPAARAGIVSVERVEGTAA